ncbi:hypothetical protein [Streptomyces sp. NPDC054834]
MLPTELSPSLGRAVVPAPPRMAQESRKVDDVSQRRTLHVMVPVAESNAIAAHTTPATPLPHGHPMLKAAHDQTGNAAVARTMARAMPGSLA